MDQKGRGAKNEGLIMLTLMRIGGEMKEESEDLYQNGRGKGWMNSGKGPFRAITDGPFVLNAWRATW